MENAGALTDNVKNELDILWENYCDDASRIAKRAEKFKREYLIPRLKGEEDLPNLDDLAEYYRSTESDPPYLPRIAVQTDMIYIWGQKEISIIIERNAATVARTLKAIEQGQWVERLSRIRKEIFTGKNTSRYLYSDEIFDLLLDYFSCKFISTRLISPRSGKKLSQEAEAEAEVWQYWSNLRSQRESWLSLSADEKFSDLTTADELDLPQRRVTRSLRSILADCAATIMDHKALSLILVLAVNLTDISRRTGQYVFYLWFAVLIPAFCYLISRLRLAATYEERRHLSKFAGLTLIAFAAWCVSFTGRLVNGDLTQSAFPYAFDKLTAHVSEIDKTQKETEVKIAEINTAVSSILDEKAARSKATAELAEERAAETRKFVKTAMKDSKRIGTEDYERIINASEESLAQLDSTQYLQRANLYLSSADIYTLWGIQDRNTALTKFEKARGYLERAVEACSYLSEEQLAEAYTSLGRLYLLEADIRHKSDLLEKASECYSSAEKYIKSSSPSLQAIYYTGLGSLTIAQAETIPIDAPAKKKRLLRKSIDDFALAQNLAGMAEDSDYLLPTIFNERSMAKRKLINIELASGDKNYRALEDYCLETIKECRDAIMALDMERQQRQIVFLRLQSATLNIQLFDIIFEQLTYFMKNDREQIKQLVEKCAEALTRADEDVLQAYKFNGTEEDYVNSGYITAKAAMTHYRTAMLLGGDKEAFEDAISLYDDALKEIPEQDNLQQNMYIAANKAVTLFSAGILLGNDEMKGEARKLAEYYLKNYSSVNYHDSLALFSQVQEADQL